MSKAERVGSLIACDYIVHVKGASLEKQKNTHFLEAAYGTSMYNVCMARVDKQIIRYKSNIER